MTSMDDKALEVARIIATLKGRDESNLISQIQLRVLNAMHWASFGRYFIGQDSAQPGSCRDKLENELAAKDKTIEYLQKRLVDLANDLEKTRDERNRAYVNARHEVNRELIAAHAEIESLRGQIGVRWGR